jgi:lipopolysaccharide/colanic/teichoic acid biosynthesis glycosyltransferase
METLREGQHSLLRSIPDRDMPVQSNNASSISLTDTEDGKYAQIVTQIDMAIPTARTPKDCTERFHPQFVDANFPIKTVSYATLKRAFDVVFSATVLLVMFLPMLLIALIVKLTSRGPVLFKQIRVGRGGRYFYCYKFRSMCVNAEAIKEKLMHLNEASGPVFKIKQDPRVTRFGAFMRKFSLDEFPQFLNVLRGDMSIVGPRPPLPGEVDLYTAHDRKRLAVRPGLTCLWQVNGRSNISFDRWVELDILYIDTMSFGNDIKIVLKTVPAVVKGSGAH